ncbi:MAG: ABC transporter permease [Verrucomicrobiae bacterium]|nr:ABC transporter permease [Verrucomicrobiae bacterium]MCP5539609.1 ABC transporter permease [Akkermansiaceae bacterium]MCP5549347.1 ABC transporter permease [Akkermansiaceae bacterium]
MKESGIFYLGGRYLRRQPAKTTLLVAALAVALFLPVGIMLFVSRAETHLRSRAATTPLLLGAPGSALELVFNGLYFSKPEVAPLTQRRVHEISADGLARGIPILARFRAGSDPIVGTSLDYFRFRGLEIREGRQLARLGECVVGARVARERGLHPGDRLVSAPEAVFDLAGVYPLKMPVVGILDATGGPDDAAVFVDVKTAWVIAGLAHGHQDAAKAEESLVLGRDDAGAVELNASVVEYTEITPENVSTFHFHGDPEDFPLSAAIVLPAGEKARTLLRGRYQDAGRDDGAQLVEPAAVMDDLFATVFQVQRIVVAALVLVAVAMGVIAALVFLLSNRLRAREFESLRNIGADPSTIRALVLFEGGAVLAMSLAVAAILTAMLWLAAPALIRHLTG